MRRPSKKHSSPQSTCHEGFSALEERHQKQINDLQQQHQKEVAALLTEKDQQLKEETAATVTGEKKNYVESQQQRNKKAATGFQSNKELMIPFVTFCVTDDGTKLLCVFAAIVAMRRAHKLELEKSQQMQRSRESADQTQLQVLYE